jgi:hypothetical protein
LEEIKKMLSKVENNKIHKMHFLQDFNVPVENVFSFFSDHNRLSEVYPALIREIN